MSQAIDPELDAPNEEHRYTMLISRLTLDKLGIRLYDKVSAVLAELIANSYDADAENVQITLPIGEFLAKKDQGELIDLGYEIRITDDGHGMHHDNVNDHYLTVGIDRRERPQKDKSLEKGRLVMGRKGIGKLAPFGICKEIELITAGGPKDQDEYIVSHFVMLFADMIGQGEGLADGDYHPKVGPLDGTTQSNRGTTIILRDFYKKRVPNQTILQRQLTARFGLTRDDWKVSVADANGASETFELSGTELSVDINLETKITVEDRPVILEDGTELPVKGWIAYAKHPYKDEVMAGVRIYSRGKIVSQTRDFGIPSGFTGEYILRSYLTGCIYAEWLDEDEDLIRSDRQDLIWNSDHGLALQEWGQEIIREIARRAQPKVGASIWIEFKKLSKFEDRVKAAFPGEENLQNRAIEVAKFALKGATGDTIKDPEYVERVVGFSLSVAPSRAIVDSLRRISSETENFDTVLSLFHLVNIAETYALGEKARERVLAIRKLRKLIKTAQHETPLQVLLEESQWLICSEWTPLVQDKSLATFRRNFEDWYEKEFGAPLQTSAIKDKRKEPDFIFIRDANDLLIVEIKKPDHSLTDKEFDRAHGYLAALRRYIKENPDLKYKFQEPRLLIVCDKQCINEKNESLLTLDEAIKRVSWTVVLNRSETAHQDFLELYDKQLEATTERE